MGMKFDQHYAEFTDNPTKQFWMDGIPENLDPRALKIFCLPNDQTAANFIDKGSVKGHDTHAMADKEGADLVKLDAQFTWNYYPVGQRGAWSDKFSKNKVAGNIWDTGVLLGKNYCDSSNERVVCTLGNLFLISGSSSLWLVCRNDSRSGLREWCQS